MRNLSRVTGAAAIASCFLATLLLIAIWAHTPPREELSHGLWSAGTISNSSAHDIWIECDPVGGKVSALYRDYDGDGFVDECLMFSGPLITVFRASEKDGLLNTMRDISEPLDSTVRLPHGSPEIGPFTRAQLDKRAQEYPVGGRKLGERAQGLSPCILVQRNARG
jgi:hypothetical protein